MSIRTVFSAILFGLLTFITTPLVGLVFVLPFLLLAKLSGGVLPESINPVIWIGLLLPGGGLGAWFGAQIVLIGILLILGDALTAVISRIWLRLWKLAFITFISAFIFQALYFYFLAVPKTRYGLPDLSGTLAQFGETERQFMEYARIGAPSITFKEPFSMQWAVNGKLETRSLYKKAEMRIPLSIKQTGNYEFRVKYGSSSHIESKFFNSGEQTAHFEFVADANDDYGWSDTKRTANIDLSYLVSSKELMEQTNREIQNMNPTTRVLYQKAREQILREGVPQIVRKFVEIKELEL